MLIISIIRLGEWIKVFNDTFYIVYLLWFTTPDDPIGIFNLVFQ
jgi:hypothetical protein